MYELAKKSREAMKSKARSLASSKDHKVDSSDWSPASPLNADVKTGMRPVSKREFKAGGAATASRADRKPRKSGGRVAEKQIGVGMANKNMKAANEQRDGVKHVGGMKNGGSLPHPKLTKPTRGAAAHYKRGGKAEGGPLPGPEEAMRSEERMKTIRTQKQAPQSFSKDQKESYEREEGYSAADRAARKSGGKKWIQSAIKKPGALHKQLGVPQGEKIPAKKLAAAADKGGKLGQRARLAETLKGFGRVGRKAGGAAPNLTVIVADKGQHPGMPQAPGRGGVMPVVTPPAAPPVQGAASMPPMPAPTPAAPPPAGMPPLARKSGGRIAKKASSYKDMEAGSGGGEGRLQKTDIASKHKNASARKSGGRAVA